LKKNANLASRASQWIKPEIAGQQATGRLGDRSRFIIGRGAAALRSS
jgi:hypothetical protein